MSGKREDYLSWDEYFMGLALLSAERSKDPSTQTGACIVGDDNRIISVGYNGATRGMSDDIFPWSSKGEATNDIANIKNTWVVHAERNAILNNHGADLNGTTLYVTFFPCNECAKSIIQSGIKKVVYLRMYSYDEIVNVTKMMFDAAGVEYMAFNQEKDFTKEEVQTSAHEIGKLIKSFSANEKNDNKIMKMKYKK